MFLFSNQKRDSSAFGLRMTERVILMSFCSWRRISFFKKNQNMRSFGLKPSG
jgi:hypothetical protein